MQHSSEYPASEPQRGPFGKVIVQSWARVGRNLALLALVLGLSTIYGLHYADTLSRPWVLHASPKGLLTLDAEQALQQFRQGQFQRLSGPGVGYGVTTQALWLVLELPAGQHFSPRQFVTVSPALLDRVDLYQVLPDDPVPHLRSTSGYQVQPSLRPLAQRQTVFDLHIDDRLPTTWLVRVQSRLYTAVLVSVQDMGAHQVGEFVDGFLLGAALFLGLMSLVLSAVVRWGSPDGYALNLSWMVLGFMAFLAMWHGHWRLWLDWASPTAAALLDATVASATLWAFYRWAASLMRLKQYPAWVLSGLRWAAFMSPLACALALQRGWSPLLGATVAAAAMILLIFVAVVLQSKHGRIQSPIYLVFGLMALVQVVIKVLAERGMLPYTSGTAYGWQIALAVSCLALMLDLLARAMDERQSARLERDRLHAMLLQEKAQLEWRVKDRAQALSQANETLRLTEGSQRELLSLASHEFRTPAAMIKSTLDAMACVEQPLPPGVAQRVESLRAASNRLIFLANKLIAHDRWRELSLKPQLRAIQAQEWVLEVMGDYDDDVPVRLDLAEEDIEMWGDPVLLRIALQTLIDNALVHAADGRQAVRVGLAAGPGHAEITVIDAGPGVADADKAQVFERFFSSGSGPSSGLGLSIVAAVARMHGGQASVSDALPRGACFHLRVPLAARQEPGGGQHAA
ncbi:MAG: hypothetical protein C4K60_00640 [Ideonella sp. MAG2]|nr:MAG: hypothetical protein C4K60_00640 [Ideonella sp. MAG2]